MKNTLSKQFMAQYDTRYVAAPTNTHVIYKTVENNVSGFPVFCGKILSNEIFTLPAKKYLLVPNIYCVAAKNY